MKNRRIEFALLALLIVFIIGQFAAPALGFEIWTIPDPYSNGNNIAELQATGASASSMIYYTGGSATITMDVDAGNLTVTGDLSAAGGFKQPFFFAHSEVGTSLSAHAPVAGAVQLASGAADSSFVYEYRMPWAGSVIGVVLQSSQPVTSGSAHVEVVTGTCHTISGQAGTAFRTRLDDAGGQTLMNSNTQSKDTDTFSAGECIAAHVATSSAFAPVQADLTVTVFVEM